MIINLTWYDVTLTRPLGDQHLELGDTTPLLDSVGHHIKVTSIPSGSRIIVTLLRPKPETGTLMNVRNVILTARYHRTVIIEEVDGQLCFTEDVFHFCHEITPLPEGCVTLLPDSADPWRFENVGITDSGFLYFKTDGDRTWQFEPDTGFEDATWAIAFHCEGPFGQRRCTFVHLYIGPGLSTDGVAQINEALADMIM